MKEFHKDFKYTPHTVHISYRIYIVLYLWSNVTQQKVYYTVQQIYLTSTVTFVYCKLDNEELVKMDGINLLDDQ